jgi:uncharacterized protein
MNINSLLNSFDFTTAQWIIAFFCAACIGMSKTGLAGIGILVIPLMAALFGGRMSTGIILPMLISADMFAVFYFRRDAEWKYIIRVLPWAIVGIIIGLFIGKDLDDQVFKKLIAVTVILSLGVNIWNDYFNKNKKEWHDWWFSASFGLVGGFSTMVGNAAGPVMIVYLISMNLPKTSFVGTAAWFFAIINLIKLPLQIWAWHNITRQGLMFNLVMLPAIAVGGAAGLFFLKKIPEKYFRIFVLSITIVGAVYLLI